MGYILTGDSKISCPHGGVVRHSSVQMEVPFIHGSPICVMNDKYDVIVCPLQGTFRCEKVEWRSGSTSTINGSPILTHLSIGFCYSSSFLLLGFPLILDYQREYLADDGG